MSPRPRHSTGRPATAVIPADWEATHAPVVLGSMRGRVTLTDPAATTQQWIDDQWIAAPAAPYASEVPARVQRLAAQSRTVVVADDQELVVDHLVVVPWGMAEVRPGHLVTVTESTDTALVGQVLRVEQVALGTERFERDLFCTLT